MKTYEIPDWMADWIDKHLKELGFGISQTAPLTKAILKASDNYQQSASTTPWETPEAQAAYLAYFFPLNYIRCLKVIDEARHWGLLSGLKEAVDFGCGPGTFSKALMQESDVSLRKLTGIDTCSSLKGLYLDSPRKQMDLQFRVRPSAKSESTQMLLASYVLNELNHIPPWIFDFENIMIVEPSTKQAFPRMLELREQLINNGYSILAPCPHHFQCPLARSKKDWCHDRVHWKMPGWFEKIENNLPIKNKTLSFSYLIASRHLAANLSYSRVVGDAQVEKGKTRWMLCRSEQREFLSFLKRQGPAPKLYRGDRLQIKDCQKKG